MTTLKRFAAASLAFAIIPALCAEARCPGNVASIRLRSAGRSLIVAPVMLDQTGPYDFVVDTGAQITTIDAQLASELHPKVLGATHVTGVGAYSQAAYAELELVQAGTYSMKNPLVLVQDLTQVRQIDHKIRGILGQNFLEHYDLLIDYVHGILCLDDTKAMQEKVRGARIALAPPPFPERNVPFREPLILPVRAPDIADQPLLLELDSGIDLPVIFKSGVQSPHVSFIGRSEHDRNADEVRQAFAVLPPQNIQVGTHSYRQISFVTPVAAGKDIPMKPDVDGVLPTVLFQSIFISYADHFAVLDPR